MLLVYCHRLRPYRHHSWVVLDVSKVIEGSSFKGLEIALHHFSGARVLRVVHPDRQEIDEHRHDWAYIGIHTAGRYREIYEDGMADMRGPCAVLHPPGRPHADLVAEEGLETLTIEFDLAWLRSHGFDRALDRSQVWQGGPVALAARQLASVLTQQDGREVDVGRATATFLNQALLSRPVRRPSWLEWVEDLLGEEEPATADLCRRVDLHPAWLARSYRHATGEGLHETARRRRVERASALLRRSSLGLAEVAAAAGFCDQSHMNRCFKSVLGRTPAQVRRETSIDAGSAAPVRMRGDRAG